MRKATPFLLLAAFLGALGWTAVLELLEARNRAFQKRTMADMRTIGQALEARATETKTYGLHPGRHAETRCSRRPRAAEARPPFRARSGAGAEVHQARAAL